MDKITSVIEHGRMKKLAAIYARKGALYILAAHRTQAGFWIDDQHIVTLREPTPAELGNAVEAALARSQDGVTTPPPSARLDKPLLEAAGVSSWATFMNSAKHVSVCIDEGVLMVTPHRNLGRKEGFEPEPDEVLKSSIPVPELGQILADRLALAQ